MVFCVTVIAMYALKHILTSVAMDALKDRERGKLIRKKSMKMQISVFGIEYDINITNNFYLL